ncbi:MAG: von Willebrand factor type A domain-containing protein [Rhizobacter sp.]|nr:von Willebrand factor type A domain-containing protein [Ferruginibacter sp.]
MKKLALYCLAVLFANIAIGQFYLRGEVKSDKNIPLQNVKIFVHSAKVLFQSGTGGSFGFTVNKPYDSLTFTLEGYETKSVYIKTSDWLNIVMKTSADFASKRKQKLISVIKDYQQTSRYKWFTSDETYFQLVENEYVNTGKFPNTGFSLNINTASYSNVRRFLNMKSRVPPDAVRVEEMMNYFNLYYKEPPAADVFQLRTHLSSCPWNDQKQLLYLNINAKKLDLDKIPPGNFVFLVDVSGSMDDEKRLPLLKAGLQSLVKNLRDQDKVSIVIYGGTVAVWLQATSGKDKQTILKSIEELTAGGDTPGESAIRLAYKVAENNFIKEGNNRVILATDGDFNVGETSEKALDELITKQKQSGVFLTCLGVGMGNFKDSKLQTLAKKGNGNYAYLDDQAEVEKVLVKELTQNFYAVADDVYMNIKFNPAMVKEYRLIGFDNKKDALADMGSDLEGGEIGSGNSTLAIFEIEPTDQNKFTTGTTVADDIATLNLKYGLCNDTTTKNITWNVKDEHAAFNELDKELRLATGITMFGLKLKQSKFFPDVEWQTIWNISNAAADRTDYLQNEFIALIEKAQKIYPDKKKKKGK